MNTLLELNNIIGDIDHFLNQYSKFIGQFYALVNEHDLNVITDVAGNMELDVPENMPDKKVIEVKNRIGVIDRLIYNHGKSISDLFKQGANIEKDLMVKDPYYKSQLSEKLAEYNRLYKSYKH